MIQFNERLETIQRPFREARETYEAGRESLEIERKALEERRHVAEREELAAQVEYHQLVKDRPEAPETREQRALVKAYGDQKRALEEDIASLDARLAEYDRQELPALGQAFVGIIPRAQSFVAENDPSGDFRSWLNKTGLGNHPAWFKFIARLAAREKQAA